MKVLTAVLAVLLLMAVCSPAEARPEASVPTFCCLRYAQRRIPLSFIVNAYKTPSMCSQPAVVLVTKKGKEVCVNPQESWVQKYMEHFQNLRWAQFPPPDAKQSILLQQEN